MIDKGLNRQVTFFDNVFFPVEYDKNHPIIRIADYLDREELCNDLALFYCPNNGRPTVSLRLKVGLLILKHLEKQSDEQVVDRLKRDVYYQYLCGVTFGDAQNAVNPSSLTHFRNQIGIEGVKMIENAVRKLMSRPPRGKKRGPKNREIVVDTTVTASPITYPTDVKLLEATRTNLVKQLEKAEKTGRVKKRHRKYKRKARKEFLLHQKLGRKSKKKRKKAVKKLLGFAKRNLRQLKESVNDIEKSALSKPLSKEEAKSFGKMKDVMRRSVAIIEQQIALSRGRKVSGRIVSFHNQNVRPIVRGKFPVNVEFGRKLLLLEKDGYLEMAGSYWDNVSDAHLTEPAIDYCEKVLDFKVEGIGADRGFHGKESNRACKKHGVKRIAIQRKGKPRKSKRPKPRWEERLRRRRCGIEGRISVAKRCYGLDRALYRIVNGEEMWSRLGLAAYNLKKAVSPR